MKTRRWRSSMAEQLICNQQVAGSIPIASSAIPATQGIMKAGSMHARRPIGASGMATTEGFPSGQREQTVNLSPLASKVRILPPPQKARMDRISDGNCASFVKRGSSSVGRAPAFQAGRRGFEPRLPLQG